MSLTSNRSVDSWAETFGKELYEMAQTMTKVKEIKDVSDLSQQNEKKQKKMK